MMNGPAVTPVTVRKIAVFRALYLGDLICATPALRALRSRFPSAEITLIGLPWAADLASRIEEVDRFSTFPGFPGLPEIPCDPERLRQFLDWMAGERIDLAIQMHGDGSTSNRFVAALGAHQTIGYAVRDDQRLAMALRWREEEHEVHRWLRLVGALGATCDERVTFPITSDDERSADALLAGWEPERGPLVGLHCGSKLPSRRWPAERFADLGNLLVQQFGARLVLTGAAHERPVTAAVRDRLTEPALELTGQTDLGTLGAVVSRFDLLLTNDTGVSHVAAATRTRSVVLFGPSDPRRWAPLDRSRHIVIDAAAGKADRSVTAVNIPGERVAVECAQALHAAGFQPRNPVSPLPGIPVATPERIS